MTDSTLSRRSFARALGAGLGGALVLPLPLAEASLPFGAAPGLVQLNSNENPTGPSPRALEALRRTPAPGRYPDARAEETRRAIAAHHGVAPEQVLLGCGSTEILRMAAMAFLGPERTLVAAEPTFEAVLAYARVPAARPRKIPLTPDSRHDLPRMAAACDASTGLVYVCNPNNPTGTLVSGEEFARFVAAMPPETVILVDEAYHDFVEDPGYRSATEWLGHAENVVVARTFSKVYGLAGMRLGYGLASAPRIRAMRAQHLWDAANAAVLDAALASLGDAAHVVEQRRLNRETRDWLCSELEVEGRRVIPSQANFVMIHLGRDAGPVIDGFRERGILVGRRFPAMPDWLRVSIGLRREMEAFLASLRALVPAAERAA